MSSNIIKIVFGLSLSLFMLDAFATSADCPDRVCRSGVYLGLMLGPTLVTRKSVDEFSTNGSDVAFGGRIYAGYLANDIFGAEIGLGGMTSVNYDVKQVNVEIPDEVINGNSFHRFRLVNVPRDATLGYLDITARLQYPICKMIKPYVRAGIALAFLSISGSVHLNEDNNVFDPDDDDNDFLDDDDDERIVRVDETNVKAAPVVAVGVALQLSDEWSVDVSYNRLFLRTKLKDVDLLAIGISYEFVDKYCGQFLCDS